MNETSHCTNCGTPLDPTGASHFCANCGAALPPPPPPGAFPPPPAPAAYLPPPSPQPDPGKSKNTMILVLAVGGGVLLLLVVILVAVILFTRKTDTTPSPMQDAIPKPTVSPTATASPTPTIAPAGWVADPSLRTGTIPARPTEGHGCLATQATMTNGNGSGTGVYGNGSPGPIHVFMAGDPLVGSFTAGGPVVRIYPLYCIPSGEPVDVGAMIDLAVTDTSGNPVPMDPDSVFDTVSGSMRSSAPVFFPIFDPASLKLTGSGATVLFAGMTADTSYKKDEIYQFNLDLTQSSTSPAVQLTATSNLVRVG